MARLNTILWAFGLLLQAALLARLLLGGAARTLPAFTGLIGFYLLRSVLLYSVLGHLSASGYASVSSLLAVLDLLFQVAVGWELWRAPTSFRQTTIFGGVLLASAACAWAVARWVPGSPRAPVDREVLFTSFVLLGVSAGTRWTDLPVNSRRVLGGFVLLACTGIAAQGGRSFAALHRNATGFLGWSYADACVYLAVLGFWLARLRSDPLSTAPGSSSPSGVQVVPR